MIELLPHQLVRVQTFMRERAGVVIPDEKLPTVHARLLRRVEAGGFNDFSEYLNHALRDEAEANQLIELLTTHETYFFRESHHLDLVREYAPWAPGQRHPGVECGLLDGSGGLQRGDGAL